MIQNITATITSSLDKIAQLARWKKRAIVILLDVILCVQSIWIAYSLRIGVWVLWDIAIQKSVLICLSLMIPVFVLTGVYNAIFRYAGTGFSRVAARYLMVDLLGRNQFDGEVKNVLIYGAGSAGQQLAASMRSEHGMRLCGYVDDDQRLDGQRLDGDKVFWSGKLQDLIERRNITDILLALHSGAGDRRSARAGTGSTE